MHGAGLQGLLKEPLHHPLQEVVQLQSAMLKALQPLSTTSAARARTITPPG